MMQVESNKIHPSEDSSKLKPLEDNPNEYKDPMEGIYTILII